MKSTSFKCVVNDIELSDVQTNTKSFSKALLSLETEDGQVFFAELKNKAIEQLSKQSIEIGCVVLVDVVHNGSEKNGKKYNNICIRKIKRINGK